MTRSSRLFTVILSGLVLLGPTDFAFAQGQRARARSGVAAGRAPVHVSQPGRAEGRAARGRDSSPPSREAARAAGQPRRRSPVVAKAPKGAPTSARAPRTVEPRGQVAPRPSQGTRRGGGDFSRTPRIDRRQDGGGQDGRRSDRPSPTATPGQVVRRVPAGDSVSQEAGRGERSTSGRQAAVPRRSPRVVRVEQAEQVERGERPRSRHAGSSEATRVGTAVRRRPGPRVEQVPARIAGSGAGRAAAGAYATSQRDGRAEARPRNRRPPGATNVTGRAVRRPLLSSPGYGGRRGRYDGARQAVSYRRYRYPQYPNRYHVHYPRYTRPGLYGSFFYFPGYDFNLGFGYGYGYPTVFGHYGYSGYTYYPSGYVGYVSGYNYADAYTGFLRLKVKPRDAQVLVDGYYVGLVDHFDGWAQRLRLEEGPHRVEIVHPAYLPIEIEVLIIPGEKITFEERMVPR